MSSSEIIFAEAFEDHEIRVLSTPEGLQWVAQDVCVALGIKSARQQLPRFRPHEKGVAICDTPGGPQTVLTVTEPGLYRLIFRSNKPEAQRFQDFVFSEVLPSIRKTGSYSAQGAEERAGDRALGLLKQRLAMIPAAAEALTASEMPMNDEFIAFVTRTVICEGMGVDPELAKIMHEAEAEAYEREDDLQDRLERIETQLDASAIRQGELIPSRLAERCAWFSSSGRPHSAAVLAYARSQRFKPDELRSAERVVDDATGKTATMWIFTQAGVARFSFLDSLRKEGTFQFEARKRTFTVYRTPEGAAAADAEGGAA